MMNYDILLCNIKYLNNGKLYMTSVAKLHQNFRGGAYFRELLSNRLLATVAGETGDEVKKSGLTNS